MLKLCIIKYNRLLTADEKAVLSARLSSVLLARISRQQVPEQADRMLIGWATVSAMLNKYFHIPPTSQDISYGDHGKPYLSHYPDIHFNISHGKSFVLCGVSDSPIGVDVQERAPYNPKIAGRFFTPRDVVSIMASRDPSRRFTICWAETESYLKRLGCGFSGGSNCHRTNVLVTWLDDHAIAVSCGEDAIENLP